MTTLTYIPTILRKLKKAYPQARCSLHFKNPFQLAVATILSAQSTDRQTNIITRTLFKKYSTPKDFAQVTKRQLEKEIYSSGFYHNKAKNIMALAQIVVKDYKGKLPSTMDQLIALPGIGRKTANVILYNAFGLPGIAVDTHVIRVSNRLGLAKEKLPTKIEFTLMNLIPRNDWGLFSHLLIDHGRAICHAQKPFCSQCFLTKECFYFKSISARL